MGATKALFTLEQIRIDDILEDTKMTTVKGAFIRSTPKAILIAVKIVMIKTNVWLPKSKIVNPDPIELGMAEVGDELQLRVPLWLAKANGLIR